jgi:uncharacterized phage protein (TIGR01671 family)
MREIKFRAWLPGIKKMTYSHTLEELMGWNTKEWTHGTAIWLQYTGLTDRNGKEIYEGDILHYKELIPSLNERQRIIQGADFVYLEFNGAVVWDEKGCSFDVDGGEHGYRGFGARGEVEVEVIGNIYEHPELLEGP